MNFDRLLNFLRHKVSLLEQQSKNKHVTRDEYSELNLSLEVLLFIEHLAKSERHKSVMGDIFSSYPYTPPVYPHSAPQPHSATYTSNTANDTICAVCKAKSPHNTHCIHRMKY